LLLLAVLLSPASAAQEPDQFGDAWSRVREYFRKRLEEQQMVGGSLWFFQNGKPLAKELYGFADIEDGRPVDENTIFHWGSITKTFTGIAIMQLRDRGLLRLEDPVIDYLPELKAVNNRYGNMNQITLKHIMTHSAGFRNPTWPWGGNESWHPHEPTEWYQLVAMMPYTEILFEPGSRYSYSNPAIIFLGRIIEQLTGDDYEVYIDKNIFKPLGMLQSYFDRTPYHLLKYRANNYYVEDGLPRANGLDFDTGITVSNGGLNSPITDMARYLAFLAGTSDGKAGGEPILARSSLAEMWQSQLPMSDPVAVPPEGVHDFIGLTFFASERGNLRLVGHTGSQKAFYSFFYVDPEARTAAIAAFNSQGVLRDGVRRPDARAILNDLRERIREQIFPLFQ